MIQRMPDACIRMQHIMQKERHSGHEQDDTLLLFLLIVSISCNSERVSTDTSEY